MNQAKGRHNILVDDVIEVLHKKTMHKRSNGVVHTKLLGFGKMCIDPPPIDLTPQKVDHCWRTLVQPVAIATGFELVSLTLNAKRRARK